MGCAATSPTDYTTYQRSTALTGDIQQDELPVKVTNPRIEFRGIALHRSEEHTSELQSRGHLVCRLLLEKKKKTKEGNEKAIKEINYQDISTKVTADKSLVWNR